MVKAEKAEKDESVLSNAGAVSDRAEARAG